MLRRFVLALGSLAGLIGLAGCSTSFWYHQFQGAQYDKCEKLVNTEDRRRCKAETWPDADRYNKQREAASGSNKT